MLASASACILLATDKRNVKGKHNVFTRYGCCYTKRFIEAAYLGVGSCWIGIYGRIDRMEKVKDFLLLEEHFEPFALVSLGYPENKDDFKFIDRYNINKVTYEV